jgi:hypothetical protein
MIPSLENPLSSDIINSLRLCNLILTFLLFQIYILSDNYYNFFNDIIICKFYFHKTKIFIHSYSSLCKLLTY